MKCTLGGRGGSVAQAKRNARSHLSLSGLEERELSEVKFVSWSYVSPIAHSLGPGE